MTVKTALVKMASTVAMVAERRVMLVALGWSLERFASVRLDCFRLQKKNHEVVGSDRTTRKGWSSLMRKRAFASIENLKERQLLDSHNWCKEHKQPTCLTVRPAACHRGQGICGGRESNNDRRSFKMTKPSSS